MSEEKFVVPQTYEQWLKLFSILSSTTVSIDNIYNLNQGRCPGVEQVAPEFHKRVQDTVNRMLKRMTKQCTGAINTVLEEGDFVNFDVIIRRYRREMKKCRFYLYINFLQSEYVQELDDQVTKETQRYWKELYRYLMTVVEETENSEIYDMVYCLKKIV